MAGKKKRASQPAWSKREKTAANELEKQNWTIQPEFPFATKYNTSRHKFSWLEQGSGFGIWEKRRVVGPHTAVIENRDFTSAKRSHGSCKVYLRSLKRLMQHHTSLLLLFSVVLVESPPQKLAAKMDCFPSCLFDCTSQQKSYKPPKILHHTPESGFQSGWQIAGESGFLCSQQELEKRLQSSNLSQPVLRAVPPTHLPPHGSQGSAALKKPLYGWGKCKCHAETRWGREIMRTWQRPSTKLLLDLGDENVGVTLRRTWGRSFKLWNGSRTKSPQASGITQNYSPTYLSTCIVLTTTIQSSSRCQGAGSVTPDPRLSPKQVTYKGPFCHNSDRRREKDSGDLYRGVLKKSYVILTMGKYTWTWH